MEKQGNQEGLSVLRRVWVGEEDRIASFHPVDTYELHTFTCMKTYIKFLQRLQRRGFRFQ